MTKLVKTTNQPHIADVLLSFIAIIKFIIVNINKIMFIFFIFSSYLLKFDIFCKLMLLNSKVVEFDYLYSQKAYYFLLLGFSLGINQVQVPSFSG